MNLSGKHESKATTATRTQLNMTADGMTSTMTQIVSQNMVGGSKNEQDGLMKSRSTSAIKTTAKSKKLG